MANMPQRKGEIMDKMNEIIKQEDSYHLDSADFLKRMVEENVKAVFTKALKCIEIRFGKDFEGYQGIRAEILRSGNDAIRDVSRIVDERFNVGIIPEVITFRINRS